MKCHRCGVEVDLPFRCNYCESFYCPEHRLPESHDCPETWRVKTVRAVRVSQPVRRLRKEVRGVLLSSKPPRLIFSRIELRDLIIGTLVVTAAGISLFIGNMMYLSLLALIVASLLFCLGFILHELAHKYVAQAYGLWAEFRLNTIGLLLSVISIFSPIKFIAPGAVVMAGYADTPKIGVTAIAGPLVNVAITAALILVSPALKMTDIYSALRAGASINAFLAVFNLIPFAFFDGKKVFTWSRRFWLTSFLVSLALMIYVNLGF